MHLEYDPEADAIYVSLTNEEETVHHSSELDDLRAVDYAENGEPVGMEFLCVSRGINLEGVPERTRIAEILRSAHLVTAA